LRVLLITVASLAASGCATRTTVRTVARSVEGPAVATPVQVAPRDFVPAVQPFGEGGRCESVEVADGRLAVLRFTGPGGSERSVSLRLDSAGAAVGYSDLRGDLRGGGGARTAITVDMAGGSGSAMNENAPAPASEGIVLASASEMMDLPNLGNPRQMIEEVRRRCIRARP
jgi:hypothetical protein